MTTEKVVKSKTDDGGVSYMYKDGNVKFDMGYGWIGFSMSVNIPEAIKIFYGG